MKYLITGGAGFIGSNLCDHLLEQGHEVRVFDNFSTGLHGFLEKAKSFDKFELVEGDVLDMEALHTAVAGVDFVFHFSANADVRFGLEHPGRDLEQNTIATFNVLEAMRTNGVRRIAFSSTGSVYGEAKTIPTTEDAEFPVQTSLYGASKLAGEGLIAAYCEGYDFQSYIFRFVSILGERYSHGHVFDFYKSLLSDPSQLRVLGDGTQRKSYLYIGDCIAAILLAIEKAQEKVNIFNLGTQETCEVKDSISWICGHLGHKPQLNFAGGKRGWVGDNPLIFLDTRKICDLGWKPSLTINEGVLKTVDYLAENAWLLESQN